MTRGLSSAIKTELGKPSIKGIIYAVRITLQSGMRRWAERTITFEGNTYDARILSISDLPFSPTDAKEITVELNNIDGLITTLDRAESWIGAKFELIEYLANIDAGYVKWVGWCDDPSEITPRSATITAFSGHPTTRAQAPRRTISPQCPWEFASGANFVDITDFDGGECPYRRTASIGYVLSLGAAITTTTETALTIIPTPSAGFTYASDQIRLFDELKIDSEVMLVTNYTASSNSVTVLRGQRGTTAATHVNGAEIRFYNCQFSVEACKRRGMYGNNTADTFVSGSDTWNHNYFGGFPKLQGHLFGFFRGMNIISLVFSRKITPSISFGSNASAYGTPLPLIYGRTRYTNPTLLLARPEGDFFIALFAVCEGTLATNAIDGTQADMLAAYVVGTDGHENIFVNGSHRHDFSPGVGLQIMNGLMDQIPPTGLYSGVTLLADVADFDLSYQGTSLVLIRINISDNPIADPEQLSVQGDFEIKYGRVVRVYTAPATYTRKATTNPAWVLLDFETSKRAGGGLDYARFDIQSFIDVAARNATQINNSIGGDPAGTYTGTSAEKPYRWTFNGIIDTQRSFSEWEAALSLSMYALPPFPGIDGKLKLKALAAPTASERANAPLFSSIGSTIRNIITDPTTGISSLKKKRKSILDIPNEIHATYLALDGVWTNYNVQSHTTSNWIKTTLIIRDAEAQRQVGIILGDTSIRSIVKKIDFPGIVTADEAARLATLILRAGEFAKGGLVNNLEISFETFYKDASDVELGDFIFVEDAILDTTTEREFRVVDIRDMPKDTSDGGVVFIRHLTCTLHLDSIYDDTALTSTLISRYGPPPVCPEMQAVETDYGLITQSVDTCYSYGSVGDGDLGGI